MILQEAFDTLKAAGLYVRDLNNGSLLGGSHIDASGPIAVIEHSFAIMPDKDRYEVRTYASGQGPGVECPTIEDAVKYILDNIKPQPDIEAPPRPPSSGTVLY